MLKILQRWRNTPEPLPPEVIEAQERLKRLAEERPSLAAAATLHGELLKCLWSAPLIDPLPSISLVHARTKLQDGIPLLRGENIVVDRPTWLIRMQQVCDVIAKQTPGASAVADAFQIGRLEPIEVTARMVSGETSELHADWERCGLEGDLADTILRFVSFPLLAHFQEQLLAVRAGIAWGRGYCPVCGSSPLFGEFRGLEQRCYLRCGHCAAPWEFSRAQCPYCENPDHRQLGFLYVEGQEARQRVLSCKQCHGHVKMIATLQALSAPQVLVKDLETLDLTILAYRDVRPNANVSGL